jgi:hypothetical protein
MVATEVMTPVAGTVVASRGYFSSITSVTGADWGTADTADTIVLGVEANSYIPAGTGYFRAAPLPRAGELETIVSAPDSASGTDITNAGGFSVAQTVGATGRGHLEVNADSPLACWPGYNITYDPPAGTAPGEAQSWRITGMDITFHSSTNRTYGIDFGGNRPQATLTGRQGRYQTR